MNKLLEYNTNTKFGEWMSVCPFGGAPFVIAVLAKIIAETTIILCKAIKNLLHSCTTEYCHQYLSLFRRFLCCLGHLRCFKISCTNHLL